MNVVIFIKDGLVAVFFRIIALAFLYFLPLRGEFSNLAGQSLTLT